MYTTLLWKTFCPGKTVRWRRTGCENFAHERTKNGNSLANRARLCYTLLWIIINKRNPAQGPERSCALGVLHTPAYNGRRTTAWKKRISRAVSIVNTLKNSAASLWEQFRSGWAGRTLGLKISYNSNVGEVKKAVYRALGLSGWPRISFAARGGVFHSATLTMLGEAGTEAVVPLENNTGWMDVMAQKLGDRMGGTGGGSITVPVYIGGEKLAETVVNALNAQTRCTGVNPLYI